MAKDKGPRRDSAKEHFWRELIARQAASELSVRAWCLRHEVPEASFYTWRRELARRDTAADVVPRFAEVVVRDQREEAALVANERPLQIYLDDVRVEAPAGFGSATLRTVHQLLRGRAC